MYTRRFDRLTQALSGQGTRRVALTGMLGSALALLGTREMDARKKKKRKKKPRKNPAPPVSPPPPPPASPPPSPPACGQGGPCLVFLSSSLHTGNLGGLSGADGICQTLATGAGLSGTYKAWVSDGTGSVSSRFVPNPGPYQLVNGTRIAASFADLRDGTLLAPIDVTETGGDRGISAFVWTATDSNGNAQLDFTCANWTTGGEASAGRIGVAFETDAAWTTGAGVSCKLASHLYCFQQR